MHVQRSHNRYLQDLAVAVRKLTSPRSADLLRKAQSTLRLALTAISNHHAEDFRCATCVDCISRSDMPAEEAMFLGAVADHFYTKYPDESLGHATYRDDTIVSKTVCTILNAYGDPVIAGAASTPAKQRAFLEAAWTGIWEHVQPYSSRMRRTANAS